MQLAKTSFVYRVAFFLTPEESRPTSTSLCGLFWRFILHLLIGIPFVWLASVLVFYIGGGIALICFGRWWNPKLSDESLSKREADHLPTFTPIKRWPRIRGRHVWPVVPIGIVAIIWIIFILPTEIWSMFRVLAVNLLQIFGLFGGIVILAFYLCRGIRRGHEKWRQSDAWTLFKAWIKAKKDKVCPIVQFQDDPQNTTTP